MNQINRLTILTFVGFIIQPFTTSFANDGEKILYKAAVAPVLSAKCGGCHGEKKQKGKLRVDTIAAMLKGGSEGPSLVPGKPDESTLLERVHLPEDDDEHMPPEGKDQLTKDEIAVLEFWIKSGAREDATVAALKATGDLTKSITAVIATAASNAGSKKTNSVATRTISPADQKLIADTIKKINTSGGGNLMPVAQTTPQLTFSALNVAKEFGDQHLEPLKSVGPHIIWLNIGNTQITDSGLASVGSMKNLTKLYLNNTKISDAALDHIKDLPELEYLNLYGTGVTDAGIAKLSGNKKLKKLFLWQTKATEEGVAALTKAIPGIYINTGLKKAEPTPAAKSTKPATKEEEVPKPKSK